MKKKLMQYCNLSNTFDMDMNKKGVLSERAREL